MTLRSTGLLDNTVVMFTADHGDLAMEHQQYYKMSMFEGSAHVPLLVMGPGLAPGLQSNHTVSLVDLYPTILGKRCRKIQDSFIAICNKYNGMRPSHSLLQYSSKYTF